MTINVTLNSIGNLQDTTTAQTNLNANNTAISGGFTTALNVTGDQMQGNLDMNSNQIINLPTPGTAKSPVRLMDFASLSASPSIVSGSNVYTGNNTFSGTANFSVISPGPILIENLTRTSPSATSLLAVADETTATSATLQVTRIETLSGVNTDGGENAGLWVYALGTNTSGATGSLPITQTNGILSQALQNGSGGAVAYFGIAHAGTDINAGFGAYMNVTMTTAATAILGYAVDLINTATSPMPWSSYNPGLTPIAIGYDANYSAPSGVVATGAYTIRSAIAQGWDVGFAAYGNSIKTAFIEDDSNSAIILKSGAGAHTTGIDLTAGTFSSYAIKTTGFYVNPVGSVNAMNTLSITAGGNTVPAYGIGGALGIYFGSGAPTITAPQGSLYMRTDGSSSSNRMYINALGATSWVAVLTSA